MNEPTGMILGIVGHAQEKFTPETETYARRIIEHLINTYRPIKVVSGRSPKGGVDIYAEQIAKSFGFPTQIFAPTRRAWDGPGGYKQRNLQIAHESTLTVCVVIEHSLLPKGVRDWGNGQCYHCENRIPRHVKSGGCWTAWRCKMGAWYIISGRPGKLYSQVVFNGPSGIIQPSLYDR